MVTWIITKSGLQLMKVNMLTVQMIKNTTFTSVVLEQIWTIKLQTIKDSMSVDRYAGMSFG